LREAAQDKGRQVSAVRLRLAAWTLFVTNVPAEHLMLREALVFGRLRWQIELLFKLWKSQGRVDESRSTNPWRILCEVYAKLLAMLLQHWIFLVSLWTYQDRSLTKAAQTVQKHARHLASAFANVQRLGRALTIVTHCLTEGCRMNRRKKHPTPINSYSAPQVSDERFSLMCMARPAAHPHPPALAARHASAGHGHRAG
jgi:hypothetical protein